MGKLRKMRSVIFYQKLKWEVDFFYDQNDQCYFTMAEVEMPEGKDRPKEIPPFLKEYCLYEVPLTDDRFANKRLGDVYYATQLLKEISSRKPI
jgi:CYTH domain-containing protein